MKKLNNKGYMLIEIIIASSLAISIGMYLIELTLNFKNKNDDIYKSVELSSDKFLLLSAIDGDVEGRKISDFDEKTNFIKFKLDDGQMRKLQINGKTIEYGKVDSGDNYVKDGTYFKKVFPSWIVIKKLFVKEKSSVNIVGIELSSIYSKKSQYIRFLLFK